MTRQLHPKTLEHSSLALSSEECAPSRRAETCSARLERSPVRSSSTVQSQGEALAATIRFKMPEEHGAWGILLVPQLCAATVAASWTTPLFLSVASTLALFLLRGSLEAQAAHNRWKALLSPSHLLLAATGGGAATVLVVFYRRYELFWLGSVAAMLYETQRLLLQKHQQDRTEKRSLPAELIGVALLTLTAPAAWIAARGSLIAGPPDARWDNLAGVKLWLLNLLFFLGGILYVKYRVRSLLVHRKFEGIGQRLAFAWPVFLFHLLLPALLITAAVQHRLPLAVLLAFTPGIVRANRLAFQLGLRFPIRRLGWSEIAHAAVFAGLLILAFRF